MMTAADSNPPTETFMQRRLRLKAEREGSTSTPPSPPVTLEVGNKRAQRWAQVKLDETCLQLTREPEGGRNHALNAAAYSLGRLVPKWLDENTVNDHLWLAGVNAGLDRVEARQTVRSGLSAGMLDPRDPPVDERDGLEALVDGPVTTRPAQRIDISLEQPATGQAERDADERLTPEQIAERNHQSRVYAELVTLRARHDAKTQHTAELAASTFRAPAYTRSLTDELLIPDQPVSYAVEDLLPSGGNALLAASYKAGKTTLVTNLLRAYADNQPFLGRFQINPGPGRIAIFNYELSGDQYRRWLRAAGIVNTDRVAVLHLRGHRLPITSPSVEDWIVNWLIEQQVSFWIADPFARAATGTDENSNTEVGVWLDTFDVIKERAGITEAVLPTHTGRTEQEQGQERARGATRLDDWADVRWLLMKDDEERRFFRATGRDVDMAEEQLGYDPLTRALTLAGGDRRWVKNRELEQRVLDYINANPGCGVRAIEAGVRGKGEQIRAARGGLLARHKVRVEDGPNNAQRHYANEVEA